MSVPAARQKAFCLQVEPSGISYSRSISVSFEAEIWYLVIEKEEPGPQARLGPLVVDIVPSMNFGFNPC